MITFLFWNLKRKNRLAVLGRLVKKHGIDMIMLAESSLGITDVLLELNSGDDSSSFHYNPGNCERIAIYSKFAKAHVSPIHEDHTITIRHLKPPGIRDMLVALAVNPFRFSTTRCGTYSGMHRLDLPAPIIEGKASKLPISGICSIKFFCDPNYCRCFRMEICP